MISWRLPMTTFSILAMIFLLVAVTSAMRSLWIEPLARPGDNPSEKVEHASSPPGPSPKLRVFRPNATGHVGQTSESQDSRGLGEPSILAGRTS